MAETVITDFWEANFKLDGQRRVIAEVARRSARRAIVRWEAPASPDASSARP